MADLRGREGREPPPSWGPKFFQFHAVFGKIWQYCMLAPPPRELAPPPRGNHGSATEYHVKNKFHHKQLKLFCLLTERRSSTSAGSVDVTSLSRTTCWSTRERTQTSVPTRATSVGKRSDARTISGTTGKQTTALEVFHNYTKLAMLEGIRVEHKRSRVQSPLEVADLILLRKPL